MTKITCPKQGNFQTPLRSFPLAYGAQFGRPKSTQNGTQNESKFKTMFKSEQVALQEPLGAVLGRSWGILEAILGSKYALPYTRASVW